MCLSLPASINIFTLFLLSAGSLVSPLFYTTNVEMSFDGEIEYRHTFG